MLTLALPDNDKLYDDKADTLDINGFGESHGFTLRPGQQPSGDMLAFLRLMNLGGKHLVAMHSLYGTACPAHANWSCGVLRSAQAPALCTSSIRPALALKAASWAP